MCCSNCGSEVAPDAGFCRNCGAILRGWSASATLIPSAPAQGPVPPASGPEPPPPPLADAGYWAPPETSAEQQYEGHSQAVHAQPPGHPRPRHSQQGYHRGYLPQGSALGQAYGSETRTAPELKYPGQAHPYANAYGSHPVPARLPERRLQAIDLAVFLGAGAVLGSLFTAWYQFALSSGGTSVSVSITALTYPAGGLWRWLMLVLSIAIMVELLVTALIFRLRRNTNWPHRSVIALLCVGNLTLVIGAMIASPFSSIGSVGLLSASLASGAYMGLAGAVVGGAAAVLHLFTGGPALTR